MSQTMPEKLRLVADAIEQGREVLYRPSAQYVWSTTRDFLDLKEHIVVSADLEYRIKPKKPRIGVINVYVAASAVKKVRAVELTDEVRKALEDAGIEID